MKNFREKILWWAAKHRVRQDKPIIIAIGGGMAKTSTKVALGTVLGLAYPGKVLTGFGNLNTYLGVPLSVLGFKFDFYHQQLGWRWLTVLVEAVWKSLVTRLPKYLILEYGTDRPGDIEALASQLQPTIAVLTIVVPAHLANYPSLEAVARDEGTLVESVGQDGHVFLNSTDPFLTMHQHRCQAHVHVVTSAPEEIARNFARSISRVLGVNDQIIQQGLAGYQPPPGRLVSKKIGPWQVIDDSYNANPVSMDSAFQVLSKLPGRKVAILGSMLELGQNEVVFHNQVGQEIRQVADLVIGVGQLAKNYQADYWFKDANSAAEQVLAHLKDGDSILIKGSRGIHMENITQALEEDSHTRY